jgi:hypothetical protein
VKRFGATTDQPNKENPMRNWRTTWMAGLLGVAGALVLAGPVRNAGAAACGDLNGDNKLTIADAVRLQKAVFVPSAADCGGLGSAQCGDVSVPDPGIGPADVVALQNFLAGRPNLYPLCGGVGPSICLANAGSGPGGESWTKRASVTGTIGSSQRWEAGCRIDVDGLTFVSPGVTITIEPGALVVGKNPPSQNGGPTNVSALIFLRGAKINASGTPANPILMTSSNHVDANNGKVKPRGDWGGLVLNGSAPVNCPGGECLAEGLVGVPFGGTNGNDSSGVLEYVRVEFSGAELSPDNELNVITMNGIGSGTIIDHVQANNGFDDCMEWFGGNVNAKFLVAAGCGDDMFDTQLGTQLNAQYALGVFYQPNLQNAGNNGFEWDNNENGFSLLPNNDVRFCNTTLVGTALQPSVGLGTTEFAMLLRRGTAGNIANTIAEHFRITGISLRDPETASHACANGTTLNNTAPILRVQHSLLFDNGFVGDGATPGTGEIAGSGLGAANCNQTQFYSLMVGQGLDPSNPNSAPGEHNPLIPVIYGTGVAGAQTDLNQFIPAGGSPGVATETRVNSLAMDCKTINPFFDTTGYLGAFRPGDPASNWLSTPWINFRLQ